MTVLHAAAVDERGKSQIILQLRRSPFIMKRFEVGARVVEPTYGLGSVIAVEDAYTRVQFDEHGIKKFLTSMSRLEPSDEPVPAGLRSGKPRKKRAPKKAAATEPSS
jgi:hypothetical protein